MNQTPRRTQSRLADNERRPRRSTVMMIRQFARAYSCSPTLPPALGSFIAN